jgi:hypothetical protein
MYNLLIIVATLVVELNKSKYLHTTYPTSYFWLFGQFCHHYSPQAFEYSTTVRTRQRNTKPLISQHSSLKLVKPGAGMRNLVWAA